MVRAVLVPGMILLGVTLAPRLHQWSGQLIVDDEWHAVHALLDHGYAAIATRIGVQDFSIPLTLLYRAIADSIGLDEVAMRAPALAAGIALPLLAYPGLRRLHLPPLEAWLASMLIAISPLAVMYSRTARPYALTMLLCALALFAMRPDGKMRPGLRIAVYTAAGALAIWLHPVVAPLVFATAPARPLARLGGGHGTTPAELREASFAVLALAIVAALLLGPPLWQDWQGIAHKANQDSATAYSVWRAAQLLAGSGYTWFLVLALLLWIDGARRLFRGWPEIATFVAVPVLVQWLAVLVARPRAADWGIVLARYWLPTLPILAVLAALSLAALARRAPRPGLRAAVLAIALAGALVAGPLPRAFYQPNQFTGHSRFTFDFDPRRNPFVDATRTIEVPEFYRRLAAEKPESIVLVEAPWRFEHPYNELDVYQRVHRQQVRAGMIAGACVTWWAGEVPARDPRFRFRHLVHLADLLEPRVNAGGGRADTAARVVPAGAVEGGEMHAAPAAGFLVFHTRHWHPVPASWWPDLADCIRRARGRFGDPVFVDHRITVFRIADSSFSSGTASGG